MGFEGAIPGIPTKPPSCLPSAWLVYIQPTPFKVVDALDEFSKASVVNRLVQPSINAKLPKKGLLGLRKGGANSEDWDTAVERVSRQNCRTLPMLLSTREVRENNTESRRQKLTSYSLMAEVA